MNKKIFACIVAALLSALSVGTAGQAVAAEGTKPILIGASVSLSGTYAASAKYALEGYELWVEQHVERALAVADRAFILADGHTVGTGTGTELLKDSKIRKAYLSV